MLRRTHYFLLVMLCSVTLYSALACGGTTIKRTAGPGAASFKPASAAVLAFESSAQDVANGAADGCLSGLLGSGLRVIERQRVDAVLAEKGFSRSGEMRPEDYKALGKMLGVDAFVAANVPATDVPGLPCCLISGM